MQEKIEKLVPDTSIIIEGLLSSKIENKEIKPEKIIIHEAVIAELEHQANVGKEIGYVGLEELKKLRELSFQLNFEIKFGGRRPKPVEIKYASLGEIDSLIRDLAWDEDATLLSSDKIQTEIAKIKGLKCIYIEAKKEVAKKLTVEKYFDENTMSIHLRENCYPYAKRGTPGRWDLIELSKKLFTQKDIELMAKELIEEARLRGNAFIETQREGSTILQIDNLRTVITRPPFSDGWEITVVRPIKQLKLEDYNLSEKLKKRIAEQAEGILIAGPPGHGKTTMGAALAEHYASKNKTVKTIEAPRDLMVSEKITQYSLNHGDPEEIRDILLLSRPDYTIFDEMRNTTDFRLFSDLRLAGIGLVGVEHATAPIDAIQRFVGRIELGVIPQVIDTVLFIQNGEIAKVLSLQMTVKVPSGMTEADLARPVVEVRDFETNKLEYEIYSYGEETVVVPIKSKESSSVRKLAEKMIVKLISKFSERVKVEIISDYDAKIFIPKEHIPNVIGRQGTTIDAIEKKLGMHIDVEELVEEKEAKQKSLEFNLADQNNFVVFYTDENNKTMDFFVNDQFLFTATSSKKGEIKVHKKSKLGRVLLSAIKAKKQVEIRLGLE